MYRINVTVFDPRHQLPWDYYLLDVFAGTKLRESKTIRTIRKNVTTFTDTLTKSLQSIMPNVALTNVALMDKEQIAPETGRRQYVYAILDGKPSDVRIKPDGRVQQGDFLLFEVYVETLPDD